jgi:hypothetical protein
MTLKILKSFLIQGNFTKVKCILIIFPEIARVKVKKFLRNFHPGGLRLEAV